MLALPAPPAHAQTEDIELTPTTGDIGQEITITGTGFSKSANQSVGAAIYFAKENAAINDRIGTESYYEITTYERLVTPREIDTDGTFSGTFDVPAELDDGILTETVTGGTYYVYVTYYYQSVATYSPFIFAKATFTVTGGSITIDPVEGTVGTEVTVSGSSFSASSTVTIKFDSQQVATVQASSAGSFSGVKFTVPASKRGGHTVEAKDASSNADTANFTTTQSMAVTPETGVVGSQLTVSGRGFPASQEVAILFDSTDITVATTDSNGSFSVSFNVPSVKTGPHVIKASDGTYDASASFSISAKIGLTPSTGYTGSEIIISGTGFLSSKSSLPILFDNELVKTISTDIQGTFTTSFVIPARKAGTYEVMVSDGVNVVSANFAISTSASISPVTSASAPGHVGTAVTVSGVGFSAGRALTVTYDDVQVASGAVKTDGSFSATFNVPPSSGGSHVIVITDVVNTSQLTFVMESNLPAIPTPLKPEMDVKTKAQTYFDWEDVTDPSGVTYTLEIAADDQFSANSTVLAKSGLTESEYTLTAEEKLKTASKEEPYYWRVRAVDGASNKSGWSGMGAFYVGGFSLSFSKPILYTLIAVGALALFGVGLWVGRRTAYY